ncbi:MAG: hypothetical protein KGO52_08355 [Nitrospirota bacterium]|nr:hypothetical protein [Nitrospirota bacterium]
MRPAPMVIVSITIAVLFVLWPQAHSSLAKVDMLPGTVVDGDDKTVQEILATFSRAEEAIRVQDLDALMNLYSTTYNYHRLNKADIRGIWAALFSHYREVSSLHLFDHVRIVHASTGSTAEIRCTGNLTAIPKRGNVPVNLDSWFGEVHYLVKEAGVWRIRGNAGDHSPEVLQFGTVPFFIGAASHPLF